MGRVYSHNGCTQCKRRKKKCDEKIPACTACARIGFTCSYDNNNPNQVKQARQLELDKLPRPPQLLNGLPFRSSIEESVVARAPGATLTFMSPFTSQYTRELKDLWQMMFGDEMVRNAIVACFSVVLGVMSPSHGKLNMLAYGRTIELLRERLDYGGDPDMAGKLAMGVSINFLGFLQATGPDTPIDPLYHFNGLIVVLSSRPDDDLQIWSSLPRNVYVLLLESLLYHICALGLFSRKISMICDKWKQSRLGDKLEKANPVGPDRLKFSPLILGQYPLFEMAIELTSLHRSESQRSHLEMHTLHKMESNLERLEAELPATFSMPVGGSLSMYQNAAYQAYRIFCKSLRICIYALREPTDQVVETVDQEASKALDIFLNIPVFPTPHQARAWGLQVLGCAIRHDEDFQLYLGHFDKIKAFLTPGHSNRADRLFKVVADLRRETESSQTLQAFSSFSRFPVGLMALRDAELVMPYDIQ